MLTLKHFKKYLKIHFYIIVPSLPRSSKLSLSLRFPHSVYNSSLTHTCHIPRSSTLSLALALDGVGGSTPRPGRFTPGTDPMPIVQEAGGTPGPVWTGGEYVAPHWDSIPGPSSP